MNSENDKNKNQQFEKIDETLDKAIENAEARRELSEEELDGVNGGIAGGATVAGGKPVIKNPRDYC